MPAWRAAIAPTSRSAAWAIKPAAQGRIHTFIATSDLHLQAKLRMTREQCLEAAVDAVRYARHHTFDVQFSAEDATRSDFDFLCRVIEAVIKVGANDDQPARYGRLLDAGRDARLLPPHPRAGAQRRRRRRSARTATTTSASAVANTLAAMQGGARQVECTINGIGERAGNAALEEIVMALHVRADRMPFTIGIDTKQIYPSSEMLTQLTGQAVQVNKAIVGRNAFAHEAGIHQDGMLKDRRTYEIMRAEDVGAPWNPLVLGKHSGRHAVQQALRRSRLPARRRRADRGLSRADGDCRRSEDPHRQRHPCGDGTVSTRRAPPRTTPSIRSTPAVAHAGPVHEAGYGHGVYESGSRSHGG